MQTNTKATLQLGTEPVGKLLMQYALPAIIAMTASSLYNMIDSIFIGQGVGPLAISGLAVTFPLMNISSAFGAMVGVGGSTMISMKLGQKDYATAEKILGNVVAMNVIVGLLIGILGLLFIDPILYFFGASEKTIPYARQFMEIILIGNVFTHLYFGLNAVLRAASKPKQAMYTTIFSVIVNIALDPIFIFVFGWGIRGAATATIVAQILALAWQIKLFSNKKEMLHLQKGIYGLHSRIVKEIVSIGMSPLCMNLCACIVVIFINNGLLRYGGDMAVGAYGIGNRIGFIFVMFVMGVNQGMQPIVGYNYGAQLYARVLKTLNYGVIAATIITTFGWIVGQFFPWECSRLFTSDPELLKVSAHGLHINLMMFPIIGFQMVATNFFQSIGKSGVSVFLSLTRQLIFLLPCLIILPPIFQSAWHQGVDGIWYSLPASDLLASIVSFVMLYRYMKKFRRLLNTQ
jgi:putative MATE family efflux protein